MATLIRTDGTETSITVTSLAEIRRAIGAETAIPVRLMGWRFLWCDEDGRPSGLPANPRATALLYAESAQPLRVGEAIVGDVVITERGELEL